MRQTQNKNKKTFYLKLQSVRRNLMLNAWIFGDLLPYFYFLFLVPLSFYLLLFQELWLQEC